MHRRGITLIEVLVAVSIFSIVVAALMRYSGYVTRRISTVQRDMDHLDKMVIFLKRLSSDVRGARQVLLASQAEIGLWRADENADSAPEPAEIVGYAWDGEAPGTIYRQDGEDTSIAISDVQELKFSYDYPIPKTRHVLLEISVGKTPEEIHRYHLSLNLRASELY